MSKHHDLKCWPEYFDHVGVGNKTFELRLNDRDFKTGDTIKLHEFKPKTESEPETFTGFSTKTFRIGYILDLKNYLGSKKDYVILSLLQMEQ